jgi:Flp pilus assembly protein TadD
LGKVRWDKQTGHESQVQVSPELVEAGNAAEKWAQPFDAPLTHVFQVQGDIAGKVAKALQVALTPAVQQALSTGPTSNLDAYDSYLRGRALSEQGGAPVTLRRAIVAYRDAVTRDSNFALAWSGLGTAYARLNYNVGDGLPGVPDSVDRATARALALAPDLPEAHVARARYFIATGHDDARAVAEAQAGLAHGPNAPLLEILAEAEEGLGQWDAAAAHAAQATTVDPREAAMFRRVALIALWRRLSADAQAADRRGLTLNPNSLDLREDLAMASLQLGDLAGAQTVLRAVPASTDEGAWVAYLGQYWDLGWVLDSAQEARLLALRPEAFDNDTATWAIVLAQQYRFRRDRARMRAYADTSLAAATRKVAITPYSSETHVFMALALAYLGRGHEAIREAEEAEAKSVSDARDRPYGQLQLARVYLAAGRRDRALDVLEQILSAPFYIAPAWLKIDPNFAELRGDPRFERLVAGTPPIA